MSNVNMGWRGTATAAYGITTGNLFTSTAFGVDDTDSGKFKIQSLTTVGAVPTGTVQLTIDPSTNGNITLNPNGTGATVLTTNLTLPTSNTALTQGIITIGAGNRWISALGTQNTFVGQGSGSTSITSAQENVGIGTSALGLLTSGSNNSCIGWGSGIKMTSAGDNVSIGAGSLNNLLTGNFNIALGTNSGNQYKGAETYNILLGSTGVTGDSGVMRLGNSQTVSTYLAGVYGNTPASSQVMTINSSGQLGSTPASSGAVYFSAYVGSNITNATGNGGIYTLGTSALTILYDNTGSMNTNGTFTAPTTGIYSFTMSVLYLNCVTTTVGQLSVVPTSGQVNAYTFGVSNSSVGAAAYASNANFNVSMTKNDTCTFLAAAFGEASDRLTIQGNIANTWITGFLIH